MNQSDHEMTFGRYSFGAEEIFSRDQLEMIARQFDKAAGESSDVLGGRGAVNCCSVEGVGDVVIKYYRRGGFIGHIIKESYLRCGVTRSCAEYKMLQKARSIGVNAPRPVLHANTGSVFYRCFLVTEEIKDQRSLATISLEDKSRAVRLVESLARQLVILVDKRIHHVDFHPGNVLVTPDDTVYIIDFDKARIFTGSREALYEKYIGRWQRALVKYDLPQELYEELRLRLM